MSRSALTADTASAAARPQRRSTTKSRRTGSECGAVTRMVFEHGVVNLTCTMPPHFGKDHYDSVFFQEWTE